MINDIDDAKISIYSSRVDGQPIVFETTFELKIVNVNGSLINKIAEQKEMHTTLVELESELEAIKSGVIIIAHEKVSLNPQDEAREK